MAHLCLVADCGGTNSRLQLYLVREEEARKPSPGHRAPGKLIHEANFANEEYAKQGKTFVDIYRDFLGQAGKGNESVSVASIAVAGPVENNRVVFTNNNWSIDGFALESALAIGRVVLMNDFVANGYGVLTLDLGAGHGDRQGEAKDVAVIQAGEQRTQGAPMACVGAGTGLGEVYLTNPSTFCPTSLVGVKHIHFKGEPIAPIVNEYTAYPTEGGHVDFAPRSPLEFELLQYLLSKFGQPHRVSVERVVSGRGLANVFEFLAQHRDLSKRVDPKMRAAFLAAGDLQGKVVAEHASLGDHVSLKAMDIFIGAYAAEASGAALKYLPFGGLFLAGGLTPKNLHLIQGEGGPFLKAFLDKGRMAPLLHKIPVFAVLDENLGQRGAHFIAIKMLRKILGPQGSAAAPAAAAAAAAPVPQSRANPHAKSRPSKRGEGPSPVPPAWVLPLAAGVAVASLVLLRSGAALRP